MLAIRVQQTVALTGTARRGRHDGIWTLLRSATLDRDRSAIRRPLTRHLPTRLPPADLLRIADQGAASRRLRDALPAQWGPVHPFGDPSAAARRPELWLVSWVDDGESELHDHAGSLGVSP